MFVNLKFPTVFYCCSVILCASLTACGGGGGGSSSNSATEQSTVTPNPIVNTNQSTEGFWIGKGKTRPYDTSTSDVFSFITPSGNYFHMYSIAPNKPVEIWYGEKIISTGEAYSSTTILPATILSSSSLVIYDWANATKIGGNIATKKSMSAKVMSAYYGGVPYSQELASIATSTYQQSYESLAKQSFVTGSYTGKIIIPQNWGMVGDDATTITVSSTGKLLGNYWSGACQLAGQLTANDSASNNVYAVTINPLSCEGSNVEFNGYATIYTDVATNKKKLIIFAKRESGGFNNISNGFGGIFILN